CALVDGLDSGGERRLRAGERAVADLKLDYVLARGLEPLGDGEHVERGFGIQASGKLTEGDRHGGSRNWERGTRNWEGGTDFRSAFRAPSSEFVSPLRRDGP